MGSMLILAGWFGLVCVSSLAYGAADIDALGGALLGMLVSASVSTLTASFVSQLRYGSIDVPITLNGLVGGLVAVSSGADVISPFLCGIVGLASGLVVVFGIEWVERSLKVDDPVGTVVTHGFCGLLGLLLTGLFASGEGLAFGGLTLMGVQLLGALAIGVWACALTYLVLSGVRRSFDLRVFDAEERGGLGLSGPSLNNAYAEYLPASTLGRLGTDKRHRVPDLPIDVAVPLVLLGGAMDCKLQKIQIICRPAYLDTLREKMREIGVTGMTILEVRGCGEQKGARETYRGIPVNVEFVPKIQVDIVVSKIPVDVVVMAARRALYTGHIGDGKIFIYGVAEAVKVRTGEHGYDAVQNIDEKSAELS
jgi:Amt family ammonium transporter